MRRLALIALFLGLDVAGLAAQTSKVSWNGQRQLVVSTRSDWTLMLTVKSPTGAKVGKETTLAVARDLIARLP
jgi:hypothetical protein